MISYYFAYITEYLCKIFVSLYYTSIYIKIKFIYIKVRKVPAPRGKSSKTALLQRESLIGRLC